jgi:hypothetical protein
MSHKSSKGATKDQIFQQHPDHFSGCPIEFLLPRLFNTADSEAATFVSDD